MFGAGQYAMRFWVKPDQLAKLNITVPEIVERHPRRRTPSIPPARSAASPRRTGQEFTYAVRAQGRLTSPEEFGDIVIRENPDGSIVRLKDVARIELGAQIYNVAGPLQRQGRPRSWRIYQLPGSNALDAANGVKKAHGAS